MSQWSTPSSGPLAARESAETGPKARKSREPVVHSVEWTTSCPKKAATGSETPKKPRPNPPLAD